MWFKGADNVKKWKINNHVLITQNWQLHFSSDIFNKLKKSQMRHPIICLSYIPPLLQRHSLYHEFILIFSTLFFLYFINISAFTFFSEHGWERYHLQLAPFIQQ